MGPVHTRGTASGVRRGWGTRRGAGITSGLFITGGPPGAGASKSIKSCSLPPHGARNGALGALLHHPHTRLRLQRVGDGGTRAWPLPARHRSAHTPAVPARGPDGACGLTGAPSVLTLSYGRVQNVKAGSNGGW